MPSRKDLHERLLATFRVEAQEHLRAIGVELDAISHDPVASDVPSRIATLFRTVHTLKGAARSIGSRDIEELSHKWEGLLRDLTQGRVSFRPAMLPTLQEAGDALAALVAGSLPAERMHQVISRLEQTSLGGGPSATKPPDRPSLVPPSQPPNSIAADPMSSAPQPSPSMPRRVDPPPPTTAAASPMPEIVRVESQRLDRLFVLAEDLLIPKLEAAEHAQRARGIADRIARLRSDVRAKGGGPSNAFSPSDVDARLREIETEMRQLTRALAGAHKSLRVAVDDLFDETRRVRMMPIAHVLEAFPSMVRDLARETGKVISWHVAGGEVEIDRKVLDFVKDPLIHLVRNAVDHGIETADERRVSGKLPEGRISIGVIPLDEGRVTIEVADDGRGMNLDALRDAAVRSRTLTMEKASIATADDLIDISFRAGVSTSPVITNISGHGLGLAIVRERVERIEGRVSVETASGKGTIIRIQVPTSVATYRGFLVRAAGLRLLLPMDSIERAVGIPRGEVANALARGLLTYGGEALPFGRLATILDSAAAVPPSDDRRIIPCVVLNGGGRRGAALVDAIDGESEVLIKDLRPPLRRLRHVLAAGLLGTGELVLVLRPSDIVGAIGVGSDEGRDVAAAETRAFRVLIVDDSITTRAMERNLFETAGYDVRVAADGVEAWTVLQQEEIDLIVSDIDMPRMNGFELTEKVRGDAGLAQLPIVLVTALEAREDKERGLRLGANAYVLKSAFDQSNLLEIVGRLL